MGNGVSKPKQTVALKGPGIRQQDIFTNTHHGKVNVPNQQKRHHLDSNSTSAFCDGIPSSDHNHNKHLYHHHRVGYKYFGSDFHSKQYNDEYRQRYLNNYHQYFLVLGYVNKYSRRDHNIDLPFDIEYLITCFCRTIDRWNIRYLDKSLIFHKKNKLTSIHPTKYGVSIGSHIVEGDNKPCYTWTVMMLHTNDESPDAEQKCNKNWIGIMEYTRDEIRSLTKSTTINPIYNIHYQQRSSVTMTESGDSKEMGIMEDIDTDIYLTQDKLLKTHHYLLDCSNGKLSPGDRRYTNGFMKAGDVMQIKLDLTPGKKEKNTLSFNINNKNYGVAFMGIENYKTKYVLVAMIGNGTEIMII